MRRIGVAIICLVVVLCLYMGDGFAKQGSAVSRLSHSGDIAGRIECPGGIPAEGVLVYIPGHSFMVKTDAEGTFTMYNVPAGRYYLAIELNPAEVFTMTNVVVNKKRITDLGVIDACPDVCSENSDCPDGYFCAKAEGDCDGQGTCQAMPEACPDVWAPVCGCDGNTYGNSCEAAAMGVNVAHDGACMTPVTGLRRD